MKIKSIKHYTFEIDNYTNGRNYKIQICVPAKTKAKAIGLIKNKLGSLVSEKLRLCYAEYYDN